MLAGEPTPPWRGWRGSRCFNPLRPLLAGEPRVGCVHGFEQRVSIHSGHCWPENREAGRSHRPSTEFQSTPAIAGRRTGRPRPADGTGQVSIHSGHCWPENHTAARVPSPSRCFNPLRPLLAGEPTTRISGASGWQFQSTPAIAGRRTLELAHLNAVLRVSIHSGHCWPENLLRDQHTGTKKVSIHSGHCWPENRRHYVGTKFLIDVSIHSGHCWPENPHPMPFRQSSASFNPLRPLLAGEPIRWFRGCQAIVSFNPLRPLLAGEPAEEPGCGSRVRVSIHSGHCWPENRTREMDGTRTACFNPLRPLLAGEPAVSDSCRWSWSFNPLRPLLAGEPHRATAIPHAAQCFNPLRPLLAGEPRRTEPLSGRSNSFQSTRAIAGRRTPSSGGVDHRAQFQSTPAIAGRRTPVSVASTDSSSAFQSTPAIAGRRTRMPEFKLLLEDVSIHSGHCWPENPPVQVTLVPDVCFNPLRPLLAGEP